MVELVKTKSPDYKPTFYGFVYKLISLFWKIEEGCNLGELSASPVKR
jgi:hypothetical protein